MKINDLIQSLAEHGITATEAEIKAQLGDISKLDPSDVPMVAELWESGSTSGKLAKPKAKPQSGSIAPLDTNHLPEVSSLTHNEVTAYIDQVERMDASGEALSDAVIGFLIELYDRRKERLTFYGQLKAALKEQDREEANLQVQLNQTIGDSVQSMQEFQDFTAKIGEGWSRMGDNFRSNSARLRQQYDRFNARVATKSRSTDEVATGSGV